MSPKSSATQNAANRTGVAAMTFRAFSRGDARRRTSAHAAHGNSTHIGCFSSTAFPDELTAPVFSSNFSTTTLSPF
ncbi:MAG: hypothetical protein QOF78_2694 [Phycisphaerales bacterium]|nr:hypothetical protein [Phycisphaerales bacterium]